MLGSFVRRTSASNPGAYTLLRAYLCSTVDVFLLCLIVKHILIAISKYASHGLNRYFSTFSIRIPYPSLGLRLPDQLPGHQLPTMASPSFRNGDPLLCNRLPAATVPREPKVPHL